MLAGGGGMGGLTSGRPCGGVWAFPPFPGALLVSQAWPLLQAETHTWAVLELEGVSGAHSIPEAGCPHGSRAGR